MAMTSKQRFLLGGVGALLPIVISICSLDVSYAINHYFTVVDIVGISIRYIITFCIGGFVVYLHDDEHKPFKLVELGVAAPALITSLITANATKVNPDISVPPVRMVSYSLSIISTASAENKTYLEKTMSKENAEDIPDSVYIVGAALLGAIIGDIYRQTEKHEIIAECTTEPTETHNVTHDCRSKVTRIVAPTGFVFNTSTLQGGEISSHGSLHECRIGWDDYVKTNTGKNNKQPRAVTLEAYAKSPNNLIFSRGWVQCKYTAQLSRYQTN